MCLLGSALTADDDESRPDDPEVDSGDEPEDDAEGEFDAESNSEEIVDLDSDAEEAEEDEEEDIDAVVAMTSKEQSARSLEVRRAIEERLEERRMHEDLDYLDLDLDD